MVILLLIALGLCLGSFVNALVWRLHEQDKPKKKQTKANLSIATGRSVCPHCTHALGFFDLIPVFSWLSLRGKCRYCEQPISWQYPIVELLTAALFVLSYVVWPYGFDPSGIFQFAVWLLFSTGFMALIVYDLKWMLLPDRIVAPLTALVIVQVVLLAVWQGNPQLVLGAVWGVLCLAGLFYVLFQVSGGKWIGGGDVKLGIVLGALVGGPLNSIAVLFIAACLGTICAAPLLLTDKKAFGKRLPFGPFLIVATIIVYLFGQTIVGWYKRQFLLL